MAGISQKISKFYIYGYGAINTGFGKKICVLRLFTTVRPVKLTITLICFSDNVAAQKAIK